MNTRQHVCSFLILLAPPAWALQTAYSSPASEHPKTLNEDRDAGAGLIHLDVTVVDKEGHAATGLAAKDFTLLDNDQPKKILTFEAFDGSALKPDPPVELILVMDEERHSEDEVSDERLAVRKFLMQNNGRLSQPVLMYRLSNAGLSGVEQPSADGNLLAAKVLERNGLRDISIEPDVSPFNVTMAAPSPSFHNPNYHPQSVLQTLGFIVLAERKKPGRKLLLWINPGKPMGENSFEWITEFSTRIREARISLFSVDLWRNPGQRSYENFLAGVRSPSQSSANDLLMEVLAEQSGGRAMEEPDNDLVRLMNLCARDAGAFYTLSFDPPRTAQTDEYHALRVDVDKAELTVRTNSGYYDEPVFHDQPFQPTARVTVQQLEEWLERSSGTADAERARQLGGMELTERMSGAELLSWKPRMRGAKAWSGLVALADASAFLDPPAADVPARSAPDASVQQVMIAKTVDYLEKTIPKLPDFFATRVTTRYEEQPIREGQTWKTVVGDQQLRVSGSSHATVLYRNGYEVVDFGGSKGKRAPKEKGRLLTKGTFGPILSTVILGAARSNLAWRRWESSPGATLAVFGYQVPKERSHYGVTYRSLSGYGNDVEPFERLTGYHGEIGVNPDTGAVYRLTVEADIEPKLPFLRSAIMVEYGPVEIGGSTHLALVRSVSTARIRTIFDLYEWGDSFKVYGPFETMLDDVFFGDYHMFHGQAHILPGFETAPAQQ